MSRGGAEAGDVRLRLLRALAAVPHDSGAAWGALAECLEKLQALDGAGIDGVARDMPADWEWAAVFGAAADALGGPDQALYAPEAQPSLAGDELSTITWQSAARTYVQASCFCRKLKTVTALGYLSSKPPCLVGLDGE